MKIGIFYGSDTGNTQEIAEMIQQQLSAYTIDLKEVGSVTTTDIESCDALLLGCSTWGYGELQSDFDTFLPKLKNAEISDKKVAFFGCGDQEGYADTFVDALGIIYEAISEKKCTIIGKISTSGYNFNESRAVKNGEFIGLPLDQDNESNLTSKRVLNWVELLQKELV